MQLTDAAEIAPRTKTKKRLAARSEIMRTILADLGAIAESDAPVLVTGESGTGKELIAREIHERSRRADRPLTSVNCAAFVDTLIDSQLFGHERGAFTGAVSRSVGRFEAADGGTLFLDEIGELPPRAQAKLLRVLQEGTFERIGSNESVHVDVRVVSATHRDLRQLVASGQFREDLFYRLKVIEVRLPPLRERREDLPAIVDDILAELSPSPPRIAATAWDAIVAYPFPGNVRELRAALQHALVLSRGDTIQLAHLPRELSAARAPEVREPIAQLAEVLRSCERRHLIEALRASGGNRTQAARMLGISRKSLWEKLRAHGIDDGEIALVERRTR